MNLVILMLGDFVNANPELQKKVAEMFVKCFASSLTPKGLNKLRYGKSYWFGYYIIVGRKALPSLESL
jgi:hypothetical protein